MKIRNKSKAFIGLVFIILLFLGGRFFYDYLNYKKELEDQRKWQELIAVEHEPLDNYKIVEELNSQRIINENIGISFLVPEGWNIEKKEGVIENYINLSSPNFHTESSVNGIDNKILEGCGIGIFITSDYFKNIRLKGEINEIREEEDREDNTKAIEIKNNLGLEKNYEEDPDFMGIEIIIPLKERILVTIGSIFNEEGEGTCLKEFELFLENILIG